MGQHALCPGNPDPVGELIRPSVIAAAHLEDIGMTGLQPRDPRRAHAGLRSGSEEADHVHGGIKVADLLRQLVLIFMEQPGGRPAGIEQIDDRLAHLRRIAAEHGRSAGLKQIVIFVSVHVRHPVAGRALDRDRERIVEGEIVLHSAGDHFLRLIRHLLRCLAAGVEEGLLVLLQRLRTDRVDRLADQRVQLSCDRLRVRIMIGINCVAIVCHLQPSFDRRRPLSREASLPGRSEPATL